MGVHVIPHDQDPRPKVPVIYARFRFDPKNFPPLPSAVRFTDTQGPVCDPSTPLVQTNGIKKHTFAEVVLQKTITEETVSGESVLGEADPHDKDVDEAVSDEAVSDDAIYEETTCDTVSANDAGSSATALPPSFSRFMELPTEIREMIWEHAMRGTLHIADRHGMMRAYHLRTPVEIREYIGVPNNIERPKFLPVMCCTSKLTMRESIGVYIRCSQFMVASINDNCLLDGFLQTVDHGYEAIQSIHFAFFDCFPTGYAQNADLELAVRCTGLRTIKIAFHMSKLIEMISGDPYLEEEDRWGPRPVENMWSHYKLARILDCGKLETVIVERKGRGDSNGITAANNLGARIQAEYSAKHKRTLDVSYTWAARVPRY